MSGEVVVLKGRDERPGPAMLICVNLGLAFRVRIRKPLAPRTPQSSLSPRRDEETRPTYFLGGGGGCGSSLKPDALSRHRRGALF